MPVDIFDTDKPTPDRVFRYPLYERLLWLMVVVVGVLVLVFLRHIRDFVAAEGQRAWVVLGVVVFFLLTTIWISLRAWISKVVISPVSLKARAFGQGVQRISWVHIQKVRYKWRPLGHKLVFIGSDGARVSFRSCIRGYDQLLGYIRESAPQHVLDQLEDIFGEEGTQNEELPEPEEAAQPAPAAGVSEAEEPEDEEPEEAHQETPRVQPCDAEPAGPAAPAAPEGAAAPEADAEAPVEDEEEGEEEERGQKQRKWWWVLLGK